MEKTNHTTTKYESVLSAMNKTRIFMNTKKKGYMN